MDNYRVLKVKWTNVRMRAYLPARLGLQAIMRIRKKVVEVFMYTPYVINITSFENFIIFIFHFIYLIVIFNG